MNLRKWGKHGIEKLGIQLCFAKIIKLSGFTQRKG